MSLEQEHSAPFSFGKHWQKLVAFYLLLLAVNVLLAGAWPLAFSPHQTDLSHIYQPPFAFQFYESEKPFHWLGTDGLGRDVLSNLVFGARTAVVVSIPVMGLATLLGVWLGAGAGYFGNRQLRMRYSSAVLYFLAFSGLFFYGFYLRQPFWSQFSGFTDILKEVGLLLMMLVLVISLTWFLKKMLLKGSKKKGAFLVPLDLIITKLIALVNSIPRLMLVLALAAFAGASFAGLLVLAVATYWTAPARLVRAEVLKIKALPYIEAARAAGLSDKQILWRHVLPNAFAPALVSFGFGAAGLLTLESTLSFLGIGVPADLASWGRLIAGFRLNMEAWWLLFFPGVILCLTILALQAGVQFLFKFFDPKQN